MKNTLSITSDCVCTCVDSIADGTNRIFAELNAGNVSAPVLKIWLGDVLKNTINLAANKLNSVEIPTALFVANGVIKFQYSDADHTGQIFSINFPDKLDGNLSVKMQSDYVYAAKYTVIGGGGSAQPYVLPPAKADTLGGIMVGDNLKVDESGRLSATAAPDPYTLPPATTASLGGVIVGDNLTVEASGRVSASKQTDNNYTDAEKQKLAGVAENANNYSLPIAGSSKLGGVKIGSNLAITDAGKLSATNTVALNYSTEEQIIGTWFDKPLYQKSFSVTFSGAVSDWTNLFDCSSLNINHLISVEGFYFYTSARIFQFDNYYTAIIFEKSDNYLKYYCRELSSGTYNGYMTIQYTKTTD